MRSLWPGACLLLAALSCGCLSTRTCSCNGCRKCGCPCAAPVAMKGAPIVARYPAAAVASAPVKHVATYPPMPPIVSTTRQPALPPATTNPRKDAPAPVSAIADAWVQRVRPSTPAASSAAANAWVQPMQPLTKVIAQAKVKKPQPVTVVAAKPMMPAEATVPAGARFGHDANYHCLVGTLEYSRIQREWLLRYVSYEEEDRYGGCVTLVAPSHGFTLKDGQTVRVEGALIDPESQQLRPAFEVRKIGAAGS